MFSSTEKTSSSTVKSMMITAVLWSQLLRIKMHSPLSPKAHHQGLWCPLSIFMSAANPVTRYPNGSGEEDEGRKTCSCLSTQSPLMPPFPARLPGRRDQHQILWLRYHCIDFAHTGLIAYEKWGATDNSNHPVSPAPLLSAPQVAAAKAVWLRCYTGRNTDKGA